VRWRRSDGHPDSPDTEADGNVRTANRGTHCDIGATHGHSETETFHIDAETSHGYTATCHGDADGDAETCHGHTETCHGDASASHSDSQPPSRGVRI